MSPGCFREALADRLWVVGPKALLELQSLLETFRDFENLLESFKISFNGVLAQFPTSCMVFRTPIRGAELDHHVYFAAEGLQDGLRTWRSFKEFEDSKHSKIFFLLFSSFFLRFSYVFLPL